uniref:methanethiol S-methyltransferase n=1 Tax=Schlesneria paludicola TaxID=360056 RepID=A0A7C4QLK1_9PLAN
MLRFVFLAYGVACHLLFLATFGYMAGFVGNLAVPKSIDAPVATPAGMALIVNLLLVAAFALQHSVMARPAFKRWWTRVVPEPIERSTYVLASCLVCWLLMVYWQPMTAVVWNVTHPLGRAVLWGLFSAGWLAVPLVSLMINHFDLFGTRQVWLHWRGRSYTPLAFRVPLFYRFVRHPLYLGWALAFWATPTMTLGHLLFAGSLTAYMGLAALIEERDLLRHFGRQYAEYQQRVPMFVPRFPKAWLAARTKPVRTTRSLVELSETR